MDLSAVLAELESVSDPERARFNARLVPTIAPERILGVRMADLRACARKLVRSGSADAFLKTAPSPIVELALLRMLVINDSVRSDTWRAAMEDFLPAIDNWMVSDAAQPRFLRRGAALETVSTILDCAQRWAAAPQTYISRTGVVILLSALRRGFFQPEHLKVVTEGTNTDYYQQMASAWYLATACQLLPERVEPLLADPTALPPAVRKLTFRKLRESRMTSPAQRERLRLLAR